MENKVEECKKHKIVKTQVSSIMNHEPTSQMHQAIRMCDKEWVQKLLNKGDSLCNRREVNDRYGHRIHNCFTLAHSGTWDFMKFLLSVDPDAGCAARNFDGQTLLMLYFEDHKVEEVKLFLELGADPDDLCDNGNTALMLALSKEFPQTVNELEKKFHGFIFTLGREYFHEKYQNIVDLLIKKGANFNIRNKNGENALHIAVKNEYAFNLEILKSLINAGYDPTVKTRENCTVLSYAIKTFVELCKVFKQDTPAKEVYQALHYLYRLAPFQGEMFKLRCDVEMHPQVILLKRLSLCQVLTRNQSILIDLLAGTTMLDPELVFMDCLQNVSQFGPDHSLECIKFPFGPLALYLNYEQYFCQTTAPVGRTYFGRYLSENLKNLISVALKCVTLQQTLSPLTVLLLHSYPHFNYVEAVKMMLNNGVHVEQRMLKFSVQDQELERLSAELCLPDVLRVALFQAQLDPEDTLELFKMFLPHFAHPGLTLLPFTTPEKVATLFPFLSSCESLQHSALHTTVKKRILDSDWLSLEHLKSFFQMNGCIPSLQALCRTVVRAHLAPRASQHGNSLPGLIKSIPPHITVSGNQMLAVAPFLV